MFGDDIRSITSHSISLDIFLFNTNSSPSAPAHFLLETLTKKCAGAEGEELVLS